MGQICTFCVVLWTYLILKKVQIWNTLLFTHSTVNLIKLQCSQTSFPVCTALVSQTTLTIPGLLSPAAATIGPFGCHSPDIQKDKWRGGNKKGYREWERKSHLVPPLPNHLDGLKTLSQDLDVKVSLRAKVSVVGSRDREVLPNYMLLFGLQVG